MKCPYCRQSLKEGPLKVYKTRDETSESALEEERRVYLCSCIKAKGIWWNCAGEATLMNEEDKSRKPLDIKDI